MAPHGPTPEANWPAKASPGRPYDWAAPYDWAVEGVLDSPSGPNIYLDTLGRLKNMALAGMAIAASTIALAYAGYWAKKEFFALDARDVPAKLPPAVKTAAASAVRIQYNYDLPIGGNGSGVKIGPDLVLTAGHVALENNEDNRLSCKGSYVYNVATFNYEWPDWIIDRQAVYDDSQDMAVLRVRPSDSFNALPTAQVAGNQPSKGEPVFFVNYESGRQPASAHYPNAETAYVENRYDMSKVYGHAAEYAGIVVGREGFALTVATGQKGYGPKAGREINTYPGGSGGPVFNRAGRLIGVVVASTVTNDRWIVMEHEVNVPHNGSGIPVSYVQPVTRDTLRPLMAELPETPKCP